MAQTFRIRTATEDDIPGLRTLIETSVRELQRSDYTAAQIEGAIGHALGLDTQLIRDRTYFAAVAAADPQQLVGCGGWSFRNTLFGSDGGPDREPRRLDPDNDAAKIRAIFVHPGWSRQGLGSAILAHCENAALQAGFTRVEMGSTLTGVPLYLLKGYLRAAEHCVPLPNGEVLPIVHMVKTLSQRS